MADARLSGTHCLGTRPGEPCLAETNAPRQPCGRVFSLARLAEHSHLAEGERGDGRKRAWSSCGSRPTSGSLRLPWQTALATWLPEPLFLGSASSRGSVGPRTLGRRALSWLRDTEDDPASVLLMIPGLNTCGATPHDLQKRASGYGVQGPSCLSSLLSLYSSTSGSPYHTGSGAAGTEPCNDLNMGLVAGVPCLASGCLVRS